MTARKKTPARKKQAAKKAPAHKRTAKATAKKKAAAAPSGASSKSVNLGHVFALRPRVNTSFRPADFQTARLLLEAEAYASVEEAARAVAEKALELTQGGPSSKRDPRKTY